MTSLFSRYENRLPDFIEQMTLWNVGFRFALANLQTVLVEVFV
ncbi:hypothetical protein ACOBV8_07225 [Pseudoalteromonas espejiana]